MRLSKPFVKEIEKSILFYSVNGTGDNLAQTVLYGTSIIGSCYKLHAFTSVQVSVRLLDSKTAVLSRARIFQGLYDKHDEDEGA